MTLRTLLFTAVLLAAGAAAAQYPVGTDDLTLVDPARGDREIPLDLYYPAVTAGEGQPPADPPAAGFAAAAFGHGYQIGAGNYGWIATRLAALGCVVAVPRTGGELFPSHETFALDLAFAARALRDAGDDPASPFHHRMGPRTLVAGHSMGGGCSVLAAAAADDVTAIMNFAAAETDPSAVAAAGGLDRPVLMFAADGDCVAPPADHQQPIFDALSGGWRILITLEGASHCQFNAYSLLCAFGEFCSADIGRQEQQTRTWDLAEPWLRAVLLGESGAVSEFQGRLDAGGGFTSQQADAPSAADGVPPAASGLSLTAHPNPFNPTLVIELTLAAPAAPVLSVTDMRGRHVRTLDPGSLPTGTHRVIWNGRDDDGHDAPAGVYLVRAQQADAPPVRAVLLR